MLIKSWELPAVNTVVTTNCRLWKCPADIQTISDLLGS